MRSLFKGLLLGLIGGVVIGIILSEQRQAREEQKEREAYASDPELVAMRQEIARERQTDRWLDSLEDENA